MNRQYRQGQKNVQPAIVLITLELRSIYLGVRSSRYTRRDHTYDVHIINVQASDTSSACKGKVEVGTPHGTGILKPYRWDLGGVTGMLRGLRVS